MNKQIQLVQVVFTKIGMLMDTCLEKKFPQAYNTYVKGDVKELGRERVEYETEHEFKRYASIYYLNFMESKNSKELYKEKQCLYPFALLDDRRAAIVKVELKNHNLLCSYFNGSSYQKFASFGCKFEEAAAMYNFLTEREEEYDVENPIVVLREDFGQEYQILDEWED